MGWLLPTLVFPMYSEVLPDEAVCGATFEMQLEYIVKGCVRG